MFLFFLYFCFNLAVCFFIAEFEEFLTYFRYKYLIRYVFCNIFSQSMTYCLIVFLISFEETYFLIFNKIQCFRFFVQGPGCCCIRKLISGHEDFLVWFLYEALHNFTVLTHSELIFV